MVFISHDLSVLASSCDRVAVMYAGEIVEDRPAAALFNQPRHPYTAALASAFPKVGDPRFRYSPAGLPGDPPFPGELPSGCPFHPRCSIAIDRCSSEVPPLQVVDDGRIACLRSGEHLELLGAGAS